MKLSAILALLPLALAMPAPQRAEDIKISISVNAHGVTPKPQHTLHFDKEYLDCDETCPEDVGHSTNKV